MSSIDFKSPEYSKVFAKRQKFLAAIANDPIAQKQLMAYYQTNIADFITDWGCTFDPRGTNKNIPSLRPFILFEKQREFINWLYDHWQNDRDGLVEKTREVGASWLSVAFAVSLCVLYPGVTIGFGSYKQMYVDTIGDLTSLLQKCRMYTNFLPPFFRAGYDEKTCSKLGLIVYPHTGSGIRGEGGDNIGRGGRTSVYIVDESGHIARPELIDAALSQTTNVRIDVSTPNGMANSFARKRFSGNIDVFTFHWRDDPRKDEVWYQNQIKRLDDPVIIAQELDINYNASHEGTILRSEWIQAAIDSHKKLGIEISGIRRLSFDVADQGRDKNAICGRHGILLENLNEWSGQESDIYASVQNVFDFCDALGYSNVLYDADGLGASVRGDARVINEKRRNKITFEAFKGSSGVLDPKKPIHNQPGYTKDDRKNIDFFENLKAQCWFDLRKRFITTYRAVTNPEYEYNPDDLISISSDLVNLTKLMAELVQPVFVKTALGKMKVDKTPEGARSPNLADSVMIAFAKTKNTIQWGNLLKR